MGVDSLNFRQALAQFATGVTVVTGVRPTGKPTGVTVSAFSSLSLHPPLVLVCLNRATGTFDAYAEGRYFAVNVLADDQEPVSVGFAGPWQSRFDGVAFETWAEGCPVLKGCLANILCRRHAVHDGGDHFILVGEVERVAVDTTRQPLLYFRGGYNSCGRRP